MTREAERLAAEAERESDGDWKRWGTYLAERQWGTVREDYSADGRPWLHFTHEEAVWRAYRWGEDGLLGFTDRKCRLCFALALWNEKDPILKERLFGLTGPEGNHGEDVKEAYFYLDNTPTHSYAKALYKYPQEEYPYELLRSENQGRSRDDPEFELTDTRVFDENRYFDVEVEYAKASPNDILIQATITNWGPDTANIRILPTWWFRNTWSWGKTTERTKTKPVIRQVGPMELVAEHETLGDFHIQASLGPNDAAPEWMFTENETNTWRIDDPSSRRPSCKDAFHLAVVDGLNGVVSPSPQGTKAAAHYAFSIPSGESVQLKMRMTEPSLASEADLGEAFDEVLAARIADADAFSESLSLPAMSTDERRVLRQAHAGLLWTKQFYNYVVPRWLEGETDADGRPTKERHVRRNADWGHLFNRDIISMPDKWEYPWYAAWDLAFHAIPFAEIDPYFAQQQALLLLREWYMHPNGQLPAYEWNFSDVNPPVLAWASWRIYQMTGPPGQRDRVFLARIFQKLLLNFTWWVNRKDIRGKHVFSGGFLGLDNIGIFDRSKPLPTGGHLEQADGTAWMAFFCSSMLSIAFELADGDPAYEDMASKFFEHYVAIAEAMNSLDGSGLWDEEDGFYYDHLHLHGQSNPLRIRSIVGLIPLLTADVLHDRVTDHLPGFRRRMEWFLDYREDLTDFMTCEDRSDVANGQGARLLAIPTASRLARLLRYLLDEDEFLSPFGIRSLSKYHQDHPFEFDLHGEKLRVAYLPGESDSGMFGGNSNWRGPIWFPLNYLLIEALDRYHEFYGDSLRVECPTRSGNYMNLRQVADEIRYRLSRLFLAEEDGDRPCYARDARLLNDPNWRDYVMFYEYFHADTGRGLGANHQTGWTALIAPILRTIAERRQ